MISTQLIITTLIAALTAPLVIIKSKCFFNCCCGNCSCEPSTTENEPPQPAPQTENSQEPSKIEMSLNKIENDIIAINNTIDNMNKDIDEIKQILKTITDHLDKDVWSQI